MKIVYRARDGGPGEITPIIVFDRMRWTNTARRSCRGMYLMRKQELKQKWPAPLKVAAPSNEEPEQNDGKD